MSDEIQVRAIYFFWKTLIWKCISVANHSWIFCLHVGIKNVKFGPPLQVLPTVIIFTHYWNDLFHVFFSCHFFLKYSSLKYFISFISFLLVHNAAFSKLWKSRKNSVVFSEQTFGNLQHSFSFKWKSFEGSFHPKILCTEQIKNCWKIQMSNSSFDFKWIGFPKF